MPDKDQERLRNEAEGDRDTENETEVMEERYVRRTQRVGKLRGVFTYDALDEP